MGQAPSAALPPVSHSQPRHRCCSICRVGCSAHTYTPQTHTLQGTVGRTSASQGEASPTNTGVRQRGGQAPRATAVYTYTTKHQAGVGSWATATFPPCFLNSQLSASGRPSGTGTCTAQALLDGRHWPRVGALTAPANPWFHRRHAAGGCWDIGHAGALPTHTHTTTTSSLQKHLSATQSPGDTPATDGEGKKVCKPDLLLEGVHGG